MTGLADLNEQYDYVSDPNYCGEETEVDGFTVICWRPVNHSPSYHQGEWIDGSQFTWRVSAALADSNWCKRL